MNQLIKENNPKFNIVLATSGSIAAIVGTYFLIKNRNHIFDLIKSFKQSQLERFEAARQKEALKSTKENSKASRTTSNNSKVSHMVNSIEAHKHQQEQQLKQTSHERLASDVKEFHSETNKSLNEKRKSIENWWKSNTKNTKSTFVSHLRGEESEEGEGTPSASEILNYKELSIDTLMSRFSSDSVNHKPEILNAILSKCKTQNLIQLFELLNKSFSEQTNADLFVRYTFNNTIGHLYTDMLVKLLTQINELTSNASDSDLKDLFQAYALIINLLFSYVLTLTNIKQNAIRKSKIEKIKYLSLNILSNLINYINVNHTSYDSNEQKFIEELLAQEADYAKLDSTKSVISPSIKTVNSSIYLDLLANLAQSCAHFDFNIKSLSPRSLYSYLKSDKIFDNLKEYESQPHYKSQLDVVYSQLSQLRSKLKNETEEEEMSLEEEEDEDPITGAKSEVIDIKCEIIEKPEASEFLNLEKISNRDDESESSVNEMKVLCLIREVEMKN